MSFRCAPPASVITRIAELAKEDPDNDGAKALSRTSRECEWAARPARMMNTTIYVEKASPPLSVVTTWMSTNPAHRALVRHLTISERGLTLRPRPYDDSDISPAEILALCATFEDLRELTLNGLNITEHTPLSVPAPFGPQSTRVLSIIGSHADTTMHAVASVATRLPGLNTLQLDGYGGEVMNVDLETISDILGRVALPLEALRVRRCTVDQVTAVNLILRSAVGTLRHLSIELWATPDPHYEIVGFVAINLLPLEQLRELDIFVPLRVDHGWYDIAAHAYPVLRMIRHAPPTIVDTHVVFWNRMDTVDAFIQALSTFPISSLCAYLRRIPTMQKLSVRAGGSDVSPMLRDLRWMRVQRLSKAWRGALRTYGHFLELI